MWGGGISLTPSPTIFNLSQPTSVFKKDIKTFDTPSSFTDSSLPPHLFEIAIGLTLGKTYFHALVLLIRDIMVLKDLQILKEILFQYLYIYRRY